MNLIRHNIPTILLYSIVDIHIYSSPTSLSYLSLPGLSRVNDCMHINDKLRTNARHDKELYLSTFFLIYPPISLPWYVVSWMSH